jgi:membrane protein involved in colicin uptake
MWRDENMESEFERRHAAAEAVRQQQETERQTAETARDTAEQSRVAAETGRRVVADEVHGTIETLTTLVDRMEAVEALRRDARKATP